MKESDYIKIYEGNLIFVLRIVSDLKAENINPVTKIQTESGLLTSVYGGSNSDYQEIYVHKDELERATKVVEKITKDSAI